MAELIVKDNALIQASYSLGLVEARLILLAIVEAREVGQSVTPETFLEIHANHYAKQFNVTPQSAYQSLSDAVETLYQRQVTLYKTYKNKPERQKVRWVSGISYVNDLAVVRIRFAPDVIPLITRLEEQFTSYELEQVVGLQSAYAVRLYELLIQWRSIGKTPVFEIAEFRQQLGVSTDEYPRMFDFKRFVLDLALTQINAHTDITVSYEQHKAGRTITGFSFTFKSKKAPEPKAKPEKASKTRLEPLIPVPKDKLAVAFAALPVEQQETVIHHVKSKLKGVKLVQFNAALSAYRSTQSKALFHEYEAIFSQALEAFASAKA